MKNDLESFYLGFELFGGPMSKEDAARLSFRGFSYLKKQIPLGYRWEIRGTITALECSKLQSLDLTFSVVLFFLALEEGEESTKFKVITLGPCICARLL